MIARRNLELVLSAVLRLEVTSECPIMDPTEAVYEAVMEEISAFAYEIYRREIYTDPSFLQYFYEATPVRRIGHLKIGSRPARRKGGKGIEDLRAIPWVFSWMQSRHLLPGWFPFGSALTAFLDRHPRSGLETLQKMVETWPFFSTLTDLIQMTLAKADMRLAARYAALSHHQGEARRIFKRIRREYELSREMILLVTRQKDLLEKNYVLKDAIPRRNVYLDPIHLLQVILLKDMMKNGRKVTAEERKALTLTFNGIAAGMKNTG
jgi:phosphoenolpyruvate carboxylase